MLLTGLLGKTGDSGGRGGGGGGGVCVCVWGGMKPFQN